MLTAATEEEPFAEGYGTQVEFSSEDDSKEALEVNSTDDTDINEKTELSRKRMDSPTPRPEEESTE